MKQSKPFKASSVPTWATFTPCLHGLQAGETLESNAPANQSETFTANTSGYSQSAHHVVGAHSSTGDRLLQDLGHRVIVANKRTLA